MVTRTPSAYSASNVVETFVDARKMQRDATAALQDRVDKALSEEQARGEFTLDVLQTPSSADGLHYFLRDLKKARWHSIAVTDKVVGVTVSVTLDAGEEIDVDMETP